MQLAEYFKKRCSESIGGTSAAKEDFGGAKGEAVGWRRRLKKRRRECSNWRRKRRRMPLNDMQLEEKRGKESMQTRAQEILNEELDEVKEMNKMVMYAKCVSVRDKQLLERKGADRAIEADKVLRRGGEARTAGKGLR